jgi:hypothetical protein
MKRLKILPEELVTLKVIMFCQFGKGLNLSGLHCRLFYNIDLEQSSNIINNFKNQVINALFKFYESKKMENFEG